MTAAWTLSLQRIGVDDFALAADNEPDASLLAGCPQPGLTEIGRLKSARCVANAAGYDGLLRDYREAERLRLSDVACDEITPVWIEYMAAVDKTFGRSREVMLDMPESTRFGPMPDDDGRACLRGAPEEDEEPAEPTLPAATDERYQRLSGLPEHMSTASGLTLTRVGIDASDRALYMTSVSVGTLDSDARPHPATATDDLALCQYRTIGQKALECVCDAYGLSVPQTGDELYRMANGELLGVGGEHIAVMPALEDATYDGLAICRPQGCETWKREESTPLYCVKRRSP